MLILLLFRKNELPLLPQKYKEGHYGLESFSNSFRTLGVSSQTRVFCLTDHKFIYRG
jgi:hypothetical protein